MSVNAHRDGGPAEYRWRPVLNAAKFGWRPLLDCRAVTLPIAERKTGPKVILHLAKFRYGATAAESVYIVYQPMQVRTKHCAKFG